MPQQLHSTNIPLQKFHHNLVVQLILLAFSLILAPPSYNLAAFDVNKLWLQQPCNQTTETMLEQVLGHLSQFPNFIPTQEPELARLEQPLNKLLCLSLCMHKSEASPERVMKFEPSFLFSQPQISCQIGGQKAQREDQSGEGAILHHLCGAMVIHVVTILLPLQVGTPLWQLLPFGEVFEKYFVLDVFHSIQLQASAVQSIRSFVGRVILAVFVIVEVC